MIVDSVLTNAKAYINGQIVDCCLAIDEGKFEKIGKETHMPQADEKSDLHNLLVLPGLIDEHVHLRDEGKSYKEDFVSGTSAAAAGGFTTILDMPNNDPVTMSKETLQNRIMLARRRVMVNVGFYSELPRTISAMKEIVEQGAIGFKFFLGNQIGGINVDDDGAIKEVLKEITALNLPLAVHAEDRILLESNEKKLKIAKRNGLEDFLRAHSETVEVKAIHRIIKLNEDVDASLHFCHVSSKEGLSEISIAKMSGKKVTCEVTPNHLLLTKEDTQRIGTMAIVAPPLRDKTHTDALWKGLDDSIIDTIGSDHAPHNKEEKMASNVWDVRVGIPGLETTLPLLLTLVKQNRLTLNQVVKLLAEKPSKILGLEKGYIQIGKRADLTIVDYNKKFKVDASKFQTKAKFSPYNGWEVNGKPIKTIVNGQLVFDEGEIVAKGGTGSIVRRGGS